MSTNIPTSITLRGEFPNRFGGSTPRGGWRAIVDSLVQRTMHDSANCPVCGGRPVNGSMTDGEFFALVERCRAETAGKQPVFLDRIRGAERWAYELTDCSLTIGDQRFAMTPIGTYSLDYRTWLWAWANDSFPPAARSAAEPLQGLRDLTGFAIFTSAGFEADEHDAAAFTALAVHHLEGIGFFRCDERGRLLYLAVHEQ